MQPPVPQHLVKKDLAPGITVYVVASGSQLTQCWVAMKAGTVLPQHSHPHEQASFVISGAVRWSIDGAEQAGPPGSGVIFAPGQVHGALVLADCQVLDVFTPVREEYLK